MTAPPTDLPDPGWIDLAPLVASYGRGLTVLTLDRAALAVEREAGEQADPQCADGLRSLATQIGHMANRLMWEGVEG